MTDHSDETRSFLISRYVQVLCGAMLVLLFAQLFRSQEFSRQLIPQVVIKHQSWNLPPGPSGWPILAVCAVFKQKVAALLVFQIGYGEPSET